jgi:putative ABC transport system permease protein
VTSPGAKRETAEMMTRAFRLNLTVLSLIALLVGLYLIFQALDGAVVRRRGEIAILRSLGVEERAIRRAWLAEAAVLGVFGGALGVLLGWAGAQFSVRAVGQTVNALYYATTVASATPSLVEILLGIGLGLVASLAAGWWPAREAARTPPAQVLVRHAAAAPGAALLRHAWIGVALVAAGCACALLPPLRFAGGGRFPLAGYAPRSCGFSAAACCAVSCCRGSPAPPGTSASVSRLRVSRLAISPGPPAAIGSPSPRCSAPSA